MKIKIGLALGLLLYIFLLAGCSGTPEAKELETAAVYSKMIGAMEEAQSYAFNTEVSQKIQFPEAIVISEDTQLDRMIIETSSSGRMLQDPLALEMTINISMPGFTDIPLFSEVAESEIKMYVTDNQLYMYYSLFDMWINQAPSTIRYTGEN